MKLFRSLAVTLPALALIAVPSFAQTQPGPGNGNAIALSQKSPEVQSAYQFLISQAHKLKDKNLKAQTLDAISNPQTCVAHRAGVDANKKNAILQQLMAAGLVDPNDNATFPGGLLVGVFSADLE
jgi:hypothetical protein